VNASRSALAGLTASAVLVAAVTLILYPLSELDPGVSSGVLYLVAVLLVAVYWGLRLGLLTSLASAAALAYFRADPHGTSFSTARATRSRSASCS
jgi:K+-sensing histidine kinase KdpD